MKVATNKDIAERGLSDIVNLELGFVMPRMAAGETVCSVGQDRLASRAATNGKKLSLTMNRYYVVEADGNSWPVEIGRLRLDGEVGHSLPPLGSQRMPLDSISVLHPHMAMKLDKGERALLRLDAMAVVQEVYPLLGWQAEFSRCTIHYNTRAAGLATLVMVRRTA